MPWINANYVPGAWVWQQDGASAHIANATQEWLEGEGWCFWRKDEWPPSSPDLAPLDYAIWDKISSVACRDPAPDIGAMKCAVNAAWRNLDTNFIRRVCRGFRPRLEAVIGAKGSHSE